MSDRPRIGLDNPAFRGRLRQPVRAGVASFSASNEVRQPFGPRVVNRAAPQPITQAEPISPLVAPPTPIARRTSTADINAPTKSSNLTQPAPAHIVTASIAEVAYLPTPKVQVVTPQAYAMPAHPKLQKSQVLRRSHSSTAPAVPREPSRAKRNKLQYAIVAMAGFVFLIGMLISLLTLQSSHAAKTQVAALAAHAQQADGSVAPNSPPAETKPTSTSMGSYRVAPDIPQQIIIPKLYVFARVRSLAVNANNELQAPSNIFDAGWYNASAKPGSGAGSGAMLIDGHVHGPTLPGVFANIKKLVAGDTIQVVRGDGKKFSYSVVKTQNFDAANLDIGAALTSATPGKPALNLITCGGPYDKQTGEYTQRTLVFAVQTDLTGN